MKEEKNNQEDSFESEKLQEELQSAMNGWKRATADYQNLKRESDTRIASMTKYAHSKMLSQLLPIFDNLDQMYKHIPDAQKTESWAVGLFNIQKQINDFLQSNKVTKINTVGEEFDPMKHESVGFEKDDTQSDHVVLKEAKAGYMYDEEVIVPAMVIINKI